MIIIKLQGGLGNQMFQYAFGKSLAKKFGEQLLLDTTLYRDGGYKGDTPRNYELDEFNIKTEIARDSDLSIFATISSNRYLKKMVSLMRDMGINIWPNYVVGQSKKFDPDIRYYPPKSFYVGFWQTEKYFVDIHNEVSNDFELKTKDTEYSRAEKDVLDNTTTISLHIRRGDNVTRLESTRVHGLCQTEYYYSAINKVVSKINSKPILVIFSDDPAWVKQNMLFDYPTIFISDYHLTNPEELYLMSKCKHNIIANSTFSWWGAWLNQYPQKIVIAPKKFFADETVDSSDLIPQSWIQL